MKEDGAIIIAVVFLLLLASCPGDAVFRFMKEKLLCLGFKKQTSTVKKRQLNENNSVFIMFGNKMPGNDLIESSGPMSNNIYVKNLGVFFDSVIRFDRQFNSGVKNVFCFS